jgi:phosphatidylserine decarboxylase
MLPAKSGRSDYPHPVIAREGWPHVLVAFAAAAFAAWYLGWAWSIPFWVVALFVTQFFRDPSRQAPEDTRAVLSPADGRVVAVGRVRDPYLQRPAQKISVFMNVFNVHSNRIPVDGKVEKVWYHPGVFFNAALDKASGENERNAVWIRTAEGQDIVAVQVAGLIARRILCYVGPGDAVLRGQRYGFIRFGSRVDLYVPETAKVNAVIGDKVHATESVVARLAALP